MAFLMPHGPAWLVGTSFPTNTTNTATDGSICLPCPALADFSLSYNLFCSLAKGFVLRTTYIFPGEENSPDYTHKYHKRRSPISFHSPICPLFFPINILLSWLKPWFLELQGGFTTYRLKDEWTEAQRAELTCASLHRHSPSYLAF